MKPAKPAGLSVVTAQIKAECAEPLAGRVRANWAREPVLLERPGSADGWMEIYFESDVAAALAREALRGWTGVKAVAIRAFADTDWDALWRSQVRRRRVGARLEICPPWDAGDGPGGGRVRVIIHPGMGFGTGEHFTTRFCLEMMDELWQKSPPEALLDVGTGSGILAIAAALLGSTRVVATDVDETALVQAAANAELNGVRDAIRWSGRDIREGGWDERFDAVCANMYAQVLVEAAPALARMAGETLILSGLREEEGDAVASTYRRHGFRERIRDGDGEWTGLLLENLRGSN